MTSVRDRIDAQASVVTRYTAIAAAVVLVLGLLSLGGGDDDKKTTSATRNGETQLGAEAPGEDGTADTTPTGDTTPDGALAPGAVGGSGAKGSTKAGGSGSKASGSSSGGGSSAPPVTATEVKVGISYLTDPETGNAAAGFTGIGQVDQKRAWDTIIAEINKNPPGGRKVVPVVYSFTTQDAQTKGAERIEQEACAKWTQDNKVFMAFSSGLDTLRARLTKAGVAQIGGGAGFSYGKTFQDYPYLVEFNAPAQDRMAAFHVDSLASQDFFSKFKTGLYAPPEPADHKPKIALIRYNPPSYKAAAAKLKERLAAKGLGLCSGCEFEIAFDPASIPAQLDEARQINAAIDNCKSKGCTHMLFLGSTAGVRITLFSVQRMEDQQYRPRLGFNTLDAPAAAAAFLGPRYYPQFEQSLLTAWDPTSFKLQTDAFKRCKAMFEKAGETFGGTDTANNKEGQIGGYCDTANYYKAVMNKVKGNLTVQSWMQSVESSGRIEAVEAFLMETKPGRHDGAGAVRLGPWFTDCNCYKPTTGELPV